MQLDIQKYRPLIEEAVKTFWGVRSKQKTDQVSKGVKDTGDRSAVTGKKQLDGFLTLLSTVAKDIGVPEDCIYLKEVRI